MHLMLTTHISENHTLLIKYSDTAESIESGINVKGRLNDVEQRLWC